MSDIPVNLPEKYRPRTFDQMVGQGHIVTRLRKDFELRKPSSLYLFTGPAGCGKTTTARMLALYMNCELMSDSHSNCTPCLQCDACMDIIEGKFPDLVEVNGADNTGIDASRELITRLRYAVGMKKWRVFIMDECHRLSAQAWDVWLKVLEQGIPRTTFAFCTSEPSKVPDTIRTRAVNKGYSFNPVPTSMITQYLSVIAEKEGILCTEESISQIALQANGSVRNGVNALASFLNTGSVDPSMLSSELQKATLDEILKVTSSIHSGRIEDAYWTASNWIKAGMNYDDIHALLMVHFSNLLTSFSLKYRGWKDTDVSKVVSQRKHIGDRTIGIWLEKLADIQKVSRNMVQFGYAVCLSYMLVRLSQFRVEQDNVILHPVTTPPSSTALTSSTSMESIPQHVSIPVDTAPLSINSPEDTFPERSVVDKLANKLDGVVSMYNVKNKMCIIFLNTGSTVRVTQSIPKSATPYILTSDIDSALSGNPLDFLHSPN